MNQAHLLFIRRLRFAFAIVLACLLGQLTAQTKELSIRPFTVHWSGGGTAAASDGLVEAAFAIDANIEPPFTGEGHFECVLSAPPGRSVDFLLILVGSIISADVRQSPIDPCSLYRRVVGGYATVKLGSGTVLHEVPFFLIVTPGGAGIGAVTIGVFDPALDGLPGDDLIGDGGYGVGLTVETGLINERSQFCR